MKSPYTPSRLLSDETAILRERSFTRWISRDLLQPATDFLKHLGLYAIYAECSTEYGYRSIQWHPPKGCGLEVRSGRAFEKFEEFDRANVDRGWSLLSLHVNENNLYSAVWITSEHFETARKVLACYGITPAGRT